MASGGDNFLVLPGGTNRVVGPVDLDALVAYVEENLGGNVTAAVEGRIVRQ
jgi:5'-nucleotidase